MLLTKAFDFYKKDKHREGYAESTLSGYELQHRLFVEYLGDVSISKVSYFDIKEYINDVSESLKPASVAYKIKYFRSLWRYCVDEGIVDENPTTRLVEPKIPRRRPNDLDEEELEMMRMSADSELERALIETFFATGCRVNEIHSLLITDIEWDDGVIQVIGKGDKQRPVFFDTRCKILLRKYLDKRKDSLPYLFVTERRYKAEGGNPRQLSTDAMRWTLKRVAKRAGVEDVHPHRLRHTFAMHMLKRGAPLDVIQKFLGHSSLETTRIYADYNEEMQRELYQQFF